MKKLTIAESRKKEVYRLACFHAENPTSADIAIARRLMNSFYRLCGLSERNLYLENNEYTCNRKSTKNSENREEQWHKRLSKEFEQFSGLTLVYCGYRPSIGIKHVNYGFETKISAYFYN